MKKQITLGCIALFFVLAFAVRLYHVFSLTILTHDGSIAYCAAAGKHNAFAAALTDRSGIYTRWASAKEWRSFLFVDRVFCFGEILSGLKNFDIHPPFYFWLLHVFMLIFGTHAWTGPLMNAFIACGSAAVLFFLARECFRNSAPASVASAIWFASPPVMGVMLMPRPYCLMTLLGLLLVWKIVSLSRSDRSVTKMACVFIAILSAIGMLTHFHFALLLAGCGLYLILGVERIEWKKCLTVFTSMAAGGVLFLLVFGNPAKVVARAKGQLQPFNWDLFDDRFKIVRYALSFFWGASAIAKIVTICFVIAALIVFILGLYGLKRNRPFRFLGRIYGDFPLLFFFVWMTGLIVTLYLCFMSPVHAMSDRYLCLVWPFMACVAVSLLKYVPKFPHAASWILACFLLVTSLITDIDFERNITPTSDPVPTFKQVEAVLIDVPARGYLFPVLFQLNDEQWVFAGWQKEILQNKERLREKRFRTLAYYNMNAYGNTVKSGEEILEWLRPDYLLGLRGTVWNAGNLIYGSRAKQWDQ